MIHHVISAAIVAFVVGAVLILQNKIEDLQTELTDLNKKENELKTECVQFQAKVEFMEKSFDSLKASLDTIAVHTKRKEEQDSIHQKKLLEIEEKKLAMQKKHLDTAKKEIDLFKEYIYFIKTSEESKQRDKRGFFG